MQLKDFIKNYPNFEECTIQTFDDNASRSDKTLCRKIPVKGIDWNVVKKLNDEGAGVYFSVNSMEKGQRDKKSVTTLNTWIVENDTLSKEEQLKLVEKSPLKPSCIVESKKSYHLYFFAKDATTENREKINRGLRYFFDGDKAICSDTSRVLRLPFTYHNKSEPFKCDCLYIEDLKYSEEEMLEKFPYTDEMINKERESDGKKPIKEQLAKKSDTIHKKNNEINYSTFKEFMWAQSSIFMLERVSKSRLIKGEEITFSKNSNDTRQIVINGKSTGSWIDTQDTIGSSKGGGPTWVNRCMYYGNKESEVMEWFWEFCDDIIPEKFNRTIYFKEKEKVVVEENKTSVDNNLDTVLRHISYKDKIRRGFEERIATNPDEIMKRGWAEFDNYLGGIYGGKIYLIGADTGVGKTTFLSQLVNNLTSAGVKVTRYSLEDRLEDNAKEDIRYTTNKIRLSKGKSSVEWIPFINGEVLTPGYSSYSTDIVDDVSEALDILEERDITEIDKTREVTIQDMIGLMNAECDKGTKVFVIDHLHYFQYESSDRNDLQIENAMKAMNEIARKRNVAVFIIAHYNTAGASSDGGAPKLSAFKGSSAIKQIANIVIQITREDYTDFNSSTGFHITKLRGPIKKKEITATFDMSTYTYNFTKTEEQDKKEKNHKEKKNRFTL